MDILTEIIHESFQSIWTILSGMVWPAYFFFLLALILKRKTLFGDMKKALPETSVNIQLILFNAIFMTPIFAILIHGMEVVFIQQDYAILSTEFWLNLPTWLVLFCAIFIGDFTGYWRHRLEHSIPLWPAHAVHHSNHFMGANQLCVQAFFLYEVNSV